MCFSLFPALFSSLSLFSLSPVAISLFPLFSVSLLSFCSTCILHHLYVCLCHTHISSLSLFLSVSLILPFLYLHNGRLRQVPQRLCAGRTGITRIYVPIWVAFNKAKYSPAFVGGCDISCIHFPCPAECSQAMYRIIPCSVF